MLVSCMNLKKLERYLRVNMSGPGPRLMKKRIYRAAFSQRLRNTGLNAFDIFASKKRLYVPTKAKRICKSLHQVSSSEHNPWNVDLGTLNAFISVALNTCLFTSWLQRKTKTKLACLPTTAHGVMLRTRRSAMVEKLYLLFQLCGCLKESKLV